MTFNPSLLRALLFSAAGLAALSCSSEAPSTTLRDGVPADVGMDAAILEGARTYAFTPERHTQAVLVMRDSTVVAEWYADNRDRESLGTSWSIGKSFTSALIGIAIDRGEIPSIDEPMHTWFPEFVGTDKEDITLHDVLEMASGIEWNEEYDPGQIDSSDIAEMAFETIGSHLAVVLDNEVAHAPATRFNYSSGDTMMLSEVIQQATGMRADQYAQEHLFSPLGIEDVRWWRDTSGRTLTYCCADMRARDFARFGELYLRGGVYAGQRIVSESWVNLSGAASRASTDYGLQFWRPGTYVQGIPTDTYSAEGVDGQFIYIIPSLELVVVRLGRYLPVRDADGVVDGTLFGDIPQGGLFPWGTAPPDDGTWSEADFLAPIIASIQD